MTSGGPRIKPNSDLVAFRSRRLAEQFEVGQVSMAPNCALVTDEVKARDHRHVKIARRRRFR
jgi:hypothetical protein